MVCLPSFWETLLVRVLVPSPGNTLSSCLHLLAGWLRDQPALSVNDKCVVHTTIYGNSLWRHCPALLSQLSCAAYWIVRRLSPVHTISHSYGKVATCMLGRVGVVITVNAACVEGHWLSSTLVAVHTRCNACHFAWLALHLWKP